MNKENKIYFSLDFFKVKKSDDCLDEDFLKEIGWNRITHYSFAHKDYNVHEHGFYMELQIDFSDYYCKLIEETRMTSEKIFCGFIKTKLELLMIMNMTHWKGKYVKEIVKLFKKYKMGD